MVRFRPHQSGSEPVFGKIPAPDWKGPLSEETFLVVGEPSGRFHLDAVMDRDPVPVRIGEGECAPEGPVKRRGGDRGTERGKIIMKLLGVRRTQPERNAFSWLGDFVEAGSCSHSNGIDSSPGRISPPPAGPFPSSSRPWAGSGCRPPVPPQGPWRLKWVGGSISPNSSSCGTFSHRASGPYPNPDRLSPGGRLARRRRFR